MNYVFVGVHTYIRRFYDKTCNTWDNRSSFIKHEGKYDLLAMDYEAKVWCVVCVCARMCLCRFMCEWVGGVGVFSGIIVFIFLWGTYLISFIYLLVCSG